MSVDLEDIKARCEAAEPGPWVMRHEGKGNVPEYRPAWKAGAFSDDGDTAQAIANEGFIAHAREDVPALVAEVERLQKQLAAAVVDIHCNWMCRVCKHRVRGMEWVKCADAQFMVGPESVDTCACFEWRGTQEGETENEQNT